MGTEAPTALDVKFAFVSRHCPRPEGTPTGRIFFAVGEGLVAEGHEVEAVAWAPDQPHDDLPPWCTWRPLPGEAHWRMRARALVLPRRDVRRIDWQPPTDAIVIAEDPLSYPKVERALGATVLFHYLTKLDSAALRRARPRDVQDMRLERHAARAPRVLCMSERVRRVVAPRATVVPMAYPVPEQPLPHVDEPTALLLANWAWPPNRRALELLMPMWPAVREAVPGALLRIAGWGSSSLGLAESRGVEVVGPVAVAADALQGVALVVFPCPATSGPKVKVLEAIAHGVPVLTTPPGAEGLFMGPDAGAVVAGTATFTDALIALLRDPGRRAAVAAGGRAAAVAHHSPRAAARARVSALTEPA